MRFRSIGLLAGLLAFGSAQALAQVAWDSPMLTPPGASPGLAMYLSDPAPGDFGVLGTWRSGAGPQNLGLRVGLAEDASSDLALYGGFDVLGSVARASNEFPLDVDWVLGAGVSAGNFVWLSFPAGLSVGHSFDGNGARFTPYITPRVMLDAFLGDHTGDDLNLDVAVDLGLDLRFQRNWAIRFGATLGDREALAIGVAF